MLSDRDYMRPGTSGNPWQQQQVSVIKPLIWANVIAFFLTGDMMAGVFGGGNGINPFHELLILHPYYVRSFQFWRLGTYMFLHANLMHIMLNMWGLYLFGGVVESRLGPSRFLRLYFISGLVGGAAWLLTNWSGVGVYEVAEGAKSEFVQATPKAILAAVSAGSFHVLRVVGGVVGASGAVFGVMMAAAMTAPELRIRLLFPPVPMKLRTFVGVYAGIEVLLAWNAAGPGAQSRIAHLAHLGGLAGAFIYMKKLGYRSPWAFAQRLLSNWRFQKAAKHFRKVSSEPGKAFGPTSSDIDRILDKIGRQGLNSLTEAERRTLQDAGDRFKKH